MYVYANVIHIQMYGCVLKSPKIHLYNHSRIALHADGERARVLKRK